MKLRFVFICIISIISFCASAQSGATADSIDILSDTSGRFIFQKVEIEATFPGGEKTWRTFLEKKLNPNVPVDNGAPIGKYTVFVQFVVDKEGNIKDVKPLTKHGYGMEEEVVRLIKIGPKWVPAVQSGRSVNAYRKQPVIFMVEDDDITISSNENYIFSTDSENQVNISVNKVKADDLNVTISQGSIVSNGNGNYTVKVNKAGKVIMEIYNVKKGNKKLGTVCFEVKTPFKLPVKQ